MKKAFLLFSALTIALGTLGQLPINGLIAWYPFCGNANDLSGNGRDLIDSNATLTTDRFGNSNAAYYFNGTNSMLYYTNILPLSGDMTISCWLKPDTAEDAELVYNGDTNANGVGLNFGSGLAYVLGAKVYALAGGITYFLPYTISTQQWHHAVLRKSSGTFTLFVDTMNTGSTSQSIFAASGHFAIGKDYTNGTNGYKGKVDDVAIYNRALSDAEIKQLFTLGQQLVTVVSSNNNVCVGDTLKFTLSTTPSTGVSYTWSGPNGFSSSSQNPTIPNVTMADSGMYYLNDTFQYGCHGSFSLHITINTAPAHTIASNSPVCEGGTLIFTNNGPNIVSSYWAGPNYFVSTLQNPQIANVTVLDSGIYYVVDSFSNGCTSNDTIGAHIIAYPPPQVSNNSPICADTQLVLTTAYSGAGATYHWTGPNGFTSSLQNPVINNASTNDAGTYTLTITLNNCRSSAGTVAIIYPDIQPGFNISGNACVGSQLFVTADNTSFNNAYYTWNFGSAQVSNGYGPGPYSIKFGDTGNYIISLVYKGACKPADTQSVYVRPLPTGHISASKTEICSEDIISLHALTDSDSYTIRWAAAIGVLSDSISAATNAMLTLSGYIYMHIYDENGCMNTDSIYVNAEPCCQLYVPNAFTPNNDGKNDIFEARSFRPFDSYLLVITNRWGQEVFTTKKMSDGWDGNFNGTLQEVGVYFYYIKYTCVGKELLKKGDITLLR